MRDEPDSPLLLPAPTLSAESELYSTESSNDPGADEIIEDGPIVDDDDDDDDDDHLLLLSLSADNTKCISPVITFIGLASRGYITCPPVNLGIFSVEVAVGAALFVDGGGVLMGDVAVVIGVLVVTSSTPLDGDARCCSSLILWKKENK